MGRSMPSLRVHNTVSPVSQRTLVMRRSPSGQTESGSTDRHRCMAASWSRSRAAVMARWPMARARSMLGPGPRFTDLDRLRGGAETADGVLHMAFGGDFADPDDMMRRDRTAIETLGQALAHSGKPFVSTSSALVMPPAGRAASRTPPTRPESPVSASRANAPASASPPRASARAWSGSPSPSTALGTTASSACSSPPPGTPACPPTSVTAATGGPRCSGATRRSCSASRRRRLRRAACRTERRGGRVVLLWRCV